MGGDDVGVVGGPAYPWAPLTNGYKVGAPLNARLFKVQKPAEVLLYADCGTRPTRPNVGGTLLDYNDELYYTSNYMNYATPVIPKEDMARLSGMMKASWLGPRGARGNAMADVFTATSHRCRHPRESTGSTRARRKNQRRLLRRACRDHPAS